MKALVHMLAVDGSYQHTAVADLAEKTWRSWCDLYGIDFVRDTVHNPDYNKPIWNKFEMFDRYPGYDMYASIDCDTMIHWNAVNLFEDLDPEKFYAVHDNASLRWINQGIKDRQHWFPGVKLSLDTYWNSGVIWLSPKHKPLFDAMKNHYFEHELELQTWSKGGGIVQTIMNYYAVQLGIEVELLPRIWNLVSMHKTELFSYNWQTGDTEPFFIKYGNVWHFTGFNIEDRYKVMNEVWKTYGKNY